MNGTETEGVTVGSYPWTDFPMYRPPSNDPCVGHGNYHLKLFSDWYMTVHGYIAAVVCVLGIIANVLNIIVLTRKNMISATNCILTGLALSDGLTMAAYLPFALRFYVLFGPTPNPARNTKKATDFLLFYACFSVVVHSISIWLTVTLAVFRYITVKYPALGRVWCTLRRARVAVFLVYVVTVFVCIPNFITLRVEGEHLPPFNSSTSPLIMWYVTFRLDTDADLVIKDLNFWVQAILVKLVPCVGLTILSVLLVQTLKEAEIRRHNLRTGGKADDKSTKPCLTSNDKLMSSSSSSSSSSSRERRTQRTTRMLLVVVALFLLTELPQGILNLLSGLLHCFVPDVYDPLGDFMDILALINNGINFILYCSMSKHFRDTFIQLFVSSINVRRQGNHINTDQ